jgi:uncharacterized protein YegP (UPF0339 family)
MPAKFEIKKDKAGKFRFNLIAPNGEVIASSEAHESKESYKNGIQSVKTMPPLQKQWIIQCDIYFPTKQSFFFSLIPCSGIFTWAPQDPFLP